MEHGKKRRGVRIAFLLTVLLICLTVCSGRAGSAAETIRSGVRTALDFGLFDDASVGRLKFVQKETEDAVAAFAESIRPTKEAALPGTVAEPFAAEHPYVLLSCTAESNVLSPVLGRVTDVSEGVHGANVTILTSDGSELLLQGFSDPVVKPGATVETGDLLGTVREAFYLYETKDGVPADASLRFTP